jgi:carbamoyl-phosphate synthase large subunit
LLAQADAFINIRVGMSESSAFELSYHIFKGSCAPVLFLVWKHSPIKTTLLRELDDLCDITYLEFEQADELRPGIADFIRRCARGAPSRAVPAERLLPLTRIPSAAGATAA